MGLNQKEAELLLWQQAQEMELYVRQREREFKTEGNKAEAEEEQ